MTAPAAAPAGTEESSAPRGLWWLSPAGAVAFVVPGTVLLAWSVTDAVYRASWKTPKSLDGGTVALLLAGAALFMAGALIPLLQRRRSAALPWPALADDQYRVLLRASRWLFWITVTGYVAFGLVGLRNGASPSLLIGAVLKQDTYGIDLREVFATVPGITTLTQVGIAYVVVAVLLLLRGPAPGVWLQLAVVLLLATGRAFVLSERLAILELAVPALALATMAWTTHRRRVVRAAVRLGPVLFVPVVFLLFGIFEYSRSWVFYRQRFSGGFLDFVVSRLSGYYVTAYNNGQLSMLHETSPDRLPYRTLEALWTAPGVEQLGLYGLLSPGNGPVAYEQVLQTYGNPEFNNPCGLCDPFVDWGPVGGLVFLLVAGFLLGLAYVAFTGSIPTALLLYPPLVTGLFELPRYLYWTQGRIVPAFLALFVVAWLVHRARPPGRYGGSS